MAVVVIRARAARKAVTGEELLSWLENAIAELSAPPWRPSQRPATVIVMHDAHGPAITIPCSEPMALARLLDPVLAAHGLRRTFPDPDDSPPGDA
ncbi:hypothetical protein SAMN05428989_2425 [Pseudoxanthomonas sp. GM95]|uniref:hypothetical protein n=1 Tax=Pseudoxanthomonas sp. GM95 TaxID=1881043 RepID=UPI0008C6CFAF|nr:hypothetical protein [Pseudoxanthomonas sp. GM95]SEL75552.1 hypothetical protein SAMN05428989_2425 [Pseudoxanthomonas sp. GM95]